MSAARATAAAVREGSQPARSSTAPPAGRHPVAVIGTFDGVHLGDRALVADAVGLARSWGVPVLAVTFNPHPRTVFGERVRRICTLEQRPAPSPSRIRLLLSRHARIPCPQPARPRHASANTDPFHGDKEGAGR